MVRQASRIVVSLVAMLTLLSVAYPVGAISTVDRSLSHAPAVRAQPSQSSTYLPIMRKAPPLPTRVISSADVDVIQGFPTSNFGSDSRMWLGYHKSSCTNSSVSRAVSRNLIQFDLSQIPPGTSITKAAMSFRVVGECWNTRTSAPVIAYRVASGWAEGSATWNSQPTTAEAAGSVSVPLNFGAGTWYTIDMTTLVREWINQSLPNYGVMLRAPEGGGNDFAYIQVASRSWFGYEPYLQITYAGASALEQAVPDADGLGTFTCEVTEAGVTLCSEAGSSASDKH